MNTKGTELLLEKFSNGIDRAVFCYPFAKNGKVYLKVFFRKKGENFFNSAYLYEPRVSTLIRYFAYPSLGQGYNKYLKNEGLRTEDFINKEKGKWSMFSILKEMHSFGIEMTLQWLFSMGKNHYDTPFNSSSITEDERTTLFALKYEKEQEELAETIKKQEEEFMLLGGDY